MLSQKILFFWKSYEIRYGILMRKDIISCNISIFGKIHSFSFQLFILVGFAISWVLKAISIRLSIQTCAYDI